MAFSHNDLQEITMLGLVRALQDHVNSNYSSVNNFLSDNGIKVYGTFSDLSEYAGYPIDAEHIIEIS